jgi:hypothetical protein
MWFTDENDVINALFPLSGEHAEEWATSITWRGTVYHVGVMAGISALASIIAVGGAGAQLAIILYNFTSVLGSAGEEVRKICTEIRLSRSLLQQLEAPSPKQAKVYPYSMNTIDAAQEILDWYLKISWNLQRKQVNRQ